MLHGVGGNGAGLLPLARHLDLPGLTFSAPDAPHPAGPGAWRWFDIAGVTVENRPARVREARAGLDTLIHGAPVLLGFSQGSIMALDALARGKVATVVAFAGRLAFDGPLTPQKGARVLLVGGQFDPMMPPEVTHEAAARLQSAGVEVTLLIEAIGHEIGPKGIEAARAFLQ